MYLGRACTRTPANPVLAQERSGPGSYPLCSPLQPWRHHVSSLTRERQQAVKQERTRSEGQACVGLTDPLPPPPCTEHCEKQCVCKDEVTRTVQPAPCTRGGQRRVFLQGGVAGRIQTLSGRGSGQRTPSPCCQGHMGSGIAEATCLVQQMSYRLLL